MTFTESGGTEVDGTGGIRRRRFLAFAATAATTAATVGGSTAIGEARPENSDLDPAVITPVDPRYRDVTSGLNPRYIGNPEAVHIVGSTAQVAEVVQRAVNEGKRLTVRSGGHCQEDFVYNPAVQVVVDLSEMKEVYFDAKLKAFAVEPGATLMEMYDLMYKTWGVTIPAGIFYSVGAGGHFAGGGHGHLSRTHGMSIDYLFGVEVVVVDARGVVRTVVATREQDDPHRDLWWAHTGGGGGNFGVVTRYWFRSPDASTNDPRAILPRPPADVLYSSIALPWSEMTKAKFGRLLTNFGAFHAKHKDPASPYLAVTSSLVLTHRSTGEVSLNTQVDGSVPDAGRMHDDYLMEVLDGVGHERLPRPRRMPWLQSVRFHGTTNGRQNDPTLRGDYKSAYMRANVPDGQVEVFYRYLTRTDIDTPGIAVAFAGYGGRINAVGQNATAFPHRDCSLNLLWSVTWEDPADDARYINWNREFYQAVYAETGGVPVPNAVTDGCYVNDADTDVADPRFNRSTVAWSELYYKDNYPRLRRIKAKWDPRNFFRHGLSIQLP